MKTTGSFDGSDGPMATAGWRVAAEAYLLVAGERRTIGPGGLLAGRDETCDIVIADERASREHARIDPAGDGFKLTDFGSRNGTQLNGEHFSGASRALRDGDVIEIAGEAMRFLLGESTRIGGTGASEPGIVRPLRLTSERLRIGRDPANDLALEDPSVSRFHAELRLRDGRVELRDLGSSNGTRVDGRFVARATIAPGVEIGIGAHRLVFDGEQVLERDEAADLHLEGTDLVVQVGDKTTILDHVSISVAPGEMVAIIGESGAGKSTLLKALAGVIEPAGGQVEVSGDQVRTRLTDLGYVPQDEIVHGRLGVRESLRYSARLRLPDDASETDIDDASQRVLDELALGEHAETQIHQLSGGQRKRVGVATELINRPGLLFLDEPTTGLDPGLERRSMELFRELADRARGRAVILVTHATRSLELCDRVVVMGAGGILCYDGPPRDALPFFGAGDYDELYTRLGERPAGEWRALRNRDLPQLPAGGASGPPAVDGRPGGKPPRRRATRQLRVLASRYARLFWRDRRNLLILGLQVPILALLMVSLFGVGLFDRPGGRAQEATQLLFLITTVAIWFGAFAAAREIVKERSVLERERAVGLRLSGYLGSKATVLLALTAAQTVTMSAIVFGLRPLNAPAGDVAGLVLILVLASWVAVGLGLLISASVRTEDQATSFLPLTLLPLLLFAGALVPIAVMALPAELISGLMFARWAYAGVGNAADANGRIAEDPEFSELSRFGETFFELSLPATSLLLLGFLAAAFAISWLLLARRR